MDPDPGGPKTSGSATPLLVRLLIHGSYFRCVSTPAKNLTKGLLTVDPRKRLSMEQLKRNSWIASCPAATYSCPLLTPTLLIAEPATERCLKQAYDAFHNATREGFRCVKLLSMFFSHFFLFFFLPHLVLYRLLFLCVDSALKRIFLDLKKLSVDNFTRKRSYLLSMILKSLEKAFFISQS
jgi:hypothetical protein